MPIVEVIRTEPMSESDEHIIHPSTIIPPIIIIRDQPRTENLMDRTEEKKEEEIKQQPSLTSPILPRIPSAIIPSSRDSIVVTQSLSLSTPARLPPPSKPEMPSAVKETQPSVGRRPVPTDQERKHSPQPVTPVQPPSLRINSELPISPPFFICSCICNCFCLDHSSHL